MGIRPDTIRDRLQQNTTAPKEGAQEAFESPRSTILSKDGTLKAFERSLLLSVI